MSQEGRFREVTLTGAMFKSTEGHIFPGLPWTETKIRYNKKFLLVWAICVMTQADIKSILIDSEPTYITSTQKKIPPSVFKELCRNEEYNKILPNENYPFYLFESCRYCIWCSNCPWDLWFAHCWRANIRIGQCRKWIKFTPSLSFCSWEEMFPPNGNKRNRKTQKDKEQCCTQRENCNSQNMVCSSNRTRHSKEITE